jgi:putative sugar O-methyltransferase
MNDAEAFARDVAAMLAHMRATGHALYQASQFWTHFNDVNMAQLRELGLANFKRSVNQNYYNWIPRSTDDNQFRNVARYWGENPALDVLAVQLEDASSIATAFGANILATPEERDLYRLFVGLLWHATRGTCGNGLTDALAEPTLGNPIRCTLGGRLISQDLANSIRERTAALAPLEGVMRPERPVSVVEIGAGYGRLGFVLLSSAPCRYTVVDIPPALGLSQWYLTTLFPQKRAFRFLPWQRFAEVERELGAADIAFLTPDQFAACPAGYFDVGITISTLPEMSRAQFDFYLLRLAETVSRVVYTKQWLEHRNVLDDVIIRRADFVLPAPWRLELDRVDGVQDAFFERLWVRGATMPR